VIAIFRVTMMLALPVWCLYLPFVIAFRDAEKSRIWILLLSGALIGPSTVVIVALILQLRGDDVHSIWQGDPLTGLCAASCIVLSLIVGFLTSIFYVIALKIFYRRSTAAPKA
jgi:hypothetical protein